jgi:formate/nitrite transporter FocA (FNT family)
MESPGDHAGHHHDHGSGHAAQSLNRLAFSATAHCLTGCAIGEVLGMIIGTALGWGDWETIVLAVALAFLFGYSLTMVPLVRGGLALGAAIPVALAADTISITIMEIVDNAIMLLIPGAMGAGLTNLLFWGSLAVSLLVAGAAAFPVNRWLIRRGRGHAVVHAYH